MNHVTDFVIRIKNASLARRKSVTMPYSNVNKAIAKTLVKSGYLAEIKEGEAEGKRVLLAGLRYESRKSVVTDVEIISKPSLRTYIGAKDLGQTKAGSATLVVSTSQGIMTGKEAIKKGLGGELLFRIW